MNTSKIMKPTITTLTTIAAASLLLCSHASAFFDDFNSYNVDEKVSIQTGTSWEDNVTSGGVQMLVDDVESPFSAVADGYSATLNDQSTTAGASVGLSYTNGGSDEATIEFDYMFSGISDNFGPYFIANDGSALGVFLRLAMSDGEATPTYTIATVNPNNTLTDIAEVAVDTWYHVTVTVSAVTDTYDVTIQAYGGSSTTSTGLSYRAGTTTMSNYMFIANNGPSATGVFSIHRIYGQSVCGATCRACRL
ncbi:hypothetical protein [Coraliomargarita parva]|uniref:hypothetical protein n=1 Tax=Coraliomargarita parva TaxID=3014050 RepID=UPI0022B564D2|nr:hypothetical protein [Coraliomargarita parva]